ncbi:MAG: hypothetical protein HQM11_14355 [SAR324 cluster bacterium]|nr:hypothetical protein [SAR324 cluster bacterium]
MAGATIHETPCDIIIFKFCKTDWGTRNSIPKLQYIAIHLLHYHAVTIKICDAQKQFP